MRVRRRDQSRPRRAAPRPGATRPADRLRCRSPRRQRPSSMIVLESTPAGSACEPKPSTTSSRTTPTFAIGERARDVLVAQLRLDHRVRLAARVLVVAQVDEAVARARPVAAEDRAPPPRTACRRSTGLRPAFDLFVLQKLVAESSFRSPLGGLAQRAREARFVRAQEADHAALLGRADARERLVCATAAPAAWR